MWNNHKDMNAFSGVEVGLEELIDLRHHAKHEVIHRNKKLKLPGEKLIRIRGRGIEFDATREYQPGDDIRNMAWRVTARSLKPYIKVYHEEKERPVWIGVDLSPSLYFGTRAMFKSVRCIRQAAVLGWSYLLKRERIGAFIATESKVNVYKPQAGEKNLLTIFNSFVKGSKHKPAFDEKNYLLHLLMTMQQHVRTGNLIFILSDFMQFDNSIQKIIINLARNAQVVLCFVYDPFEAEPPPPYPYVLTNGRKQVAFNMNDLQSRQQYQQQFQLKQNELIDFTRKHHIGLQMLCTEQSKEE